MAEVVLVDLKSKRMDVFVTAELSEEGLVIGCSSVDKSDEDYGEVDSEFSYELETDETDKLYSCLKSDYKCDEELLPMLKRAFKGYSATDSFVNYCKKNKVKYIYNIW